MKRTKCGIIGCGMISDTYFKAAKRFRNIEVIACSDIIAERAKQKEEAYGAKAMTNEELLAIPEIEIVLNLTPPLVHSKIDIDVLNAGKHVYSEKPFGVDAEDAKKVVELAKAKGLRVGCAPDTFLGGGLQTARKMIDDNWIGKPLSGTAIVQGRGPEKWGQAPFFYDYGAGPMLDLGPYYITALVNMLGSAKSVTAITGKGYESRTFGAEVAEQYQDKYKPYDSYPVTVSTHLAGVVEFECGALITGESLGQVASQTMQALGVTDICVKDMPVFRPCIGMDKEEIVTISRKMGAFETSIQPYEDCCTVFTPKHPRTRPELAKVLAEEQKLDFEALVQEALDGAYVERIRTEF